MIEPTFPVGAVGREGHEPDRRACFSSAVSGPVIETGIEVYRSLRRRDCEERGFMLGAVGIASALVVWQEYFTLEVAAADLERAAAHLRQYEAENRPPAPAPSAPALHPHAWAGCVAYAVCLLGVAYAISNGLVRLDAFQVGELDAARVQSGQWWRAWTALTLHLSGPHLAANLGAGIWFGYLAGRQLGVGAAWLLIVLGSGIANWVEGFFGPPWHESVGASTAVFTALGLMAAYTWRERLRLPQSWVSRWGPLVAGIVLLGWLGTAGKHTDIMAHVLGFAVGALLGWTVALPAVSQRLHRAPQWPAALAAAAIMAVAWGFALAS